MAEEKGNELYHNKDGEDIYIEERGDTPSDYPYASGRNEKNSHTHREKAKHCPRRKKNGKRRFLH